MELSGEVLVRIGALLEQQLHQVERRQLVRIVRPQTRSVVGKLIRGRLAHFDGDVKRSIVDVRAELGQRRRHVEPVVVDGDHHRGRAVAVLEIEVRLAGGETPDRGFVALDARQTSTP